ncbi:TPA: hypothetical protein ACHYYN_002487 [Escherichia coli]|uniref:hypothetical protein n=1 Tax=Escherichia coli TaxID=562 RepID=UPI000AD1EE7D
MTRNTELTRTALYRLALQRFGPDAQALKLTEEAAELAASAARNLNGQGSESDLAAELADVEIMTEQLRRIRPGCPADPRGDAVVMGKA